MTSSPLQQLQVLKHQLSLFGALHASLLPFFFNIYFPSVPYSLSRFFSISLFPSSLLSPLLTSFNPPSSITFHPPFPSLSPFCGPPSSCPPPGLLPRWPNAMPPHRSAHPGPRAGRAEWRGRGSAAGAGGEGLGEDGELGVVVLAAMQSAPPPPSHGTSCSFQLH